ncbi:MULTISPECIES: type II CAAX endopeptidase family protein [Sporosarcina]|uniref:Type II CAAX endopeptidase family protein n=1 Tax=Sporosarcina contaminans TaxID=633403 RepID=A0ABW3U2F1_9BACL
MKNWKIYISIVAIYLLMQFGSLPLRDMFIGYFQTSGMSELDAIMYGIAWGLFIANVIAAPIMFFMTTRNKKFWNIFKKGKKASFGKTILWGVLGFLLAMAGQMLAAIIEMSLGIMPGSQNTSDLGNIAKVAPIIIISIVIFAPLLEELVFRRVLFGGIYTKTNFWIAAIASGLIFAAVHNEFEHLLMYMTPGLIFAFIYYYTQRIWAPMISHMLMNGFVTIAQLNADKLEEIQKMKQAIIIFFQ